MLVLMLIFIFICLLLGFPVAFVLSGISLIFAYLGSLFGVFDFTFIEAIPDRIYGIMKNDLLVAVPLFVFMGIMLEKSKIAEEMLSGMASIFGNMKSGLGICVVLVGALLAASTGIVCATVITMGLISLPVMLKSGYDSKISTGVICASGTLGQIIPPSIVLILLGDQISNAYQNAQLKMGNLSPETISIADIFAGALIPGIILVILYIIWLIIYGFLYPDKVPAAKIKDKINIVQITKIILPPLILIIIVLGAILGGFATATESAAIGAFGAIILAYFYKQLNLENLKNVVNETAKTSAMVFTILIGATIFTLVLRGYGGEEYIHQFLVNIPGGLFTVMLITMIFIFLLGFILDFIEIIFVVVPIICPVLLMMGANPIWLAIMIAINLQTSFLTPPFGFSLFYLRGVAPKKIITSNIYKGVIPFILIQIFMLILLAVFPRFATFLPEKIYGSNLDFKEVNIIEVDEDQYGIDF